MTLLPPYDIGTVTLTNGSADIVGNDTAWAVNGVTGGLMTVEAAGGNPLLLADVADDTTATAATKWMGPSGTFKYAISLESAQAADVVWANRHWSRVVGQGLLAAIRPDASGTLAERDALNPMLDNGQWFARAEPPHDLEFYRKVPGGWEGPFTTRGVGGVGEGGLGLPSPGAAGLIPYYSAPNTVLLGDGPAIRGIIGVRERLTANRTYYVRTDGSNSNTGLSNRSGGAFLTIQRAIDVATALDLNGYTVTIQVANGTYTGTVQARSLTGGGSVIIVGDETTPSNVVISTTSANCFNANDVVGTYALRGMKLQTTTSGSGIAASFGSVVRFQNIDFGAMAGYHISATMRAIVNATGDYSITGRAQSHWFVDQGGSSDFTARTVTITGTPAFSVAFAYCRILSFIKCNAITFSGSATGKRYNVTENSAIFTFGGGATYLPGDSAGAAGSGGQYV